MQQVFKQIGIPWRRSAGAPVRAVGLFAALTLLFGLPAAHAGGIAGTVRDAVTQAPLATIDMDLFDSNWNPITLSNDNTDDTGNYLLTPIPAGNYFVRADPTAAQGYVDAYYPGVFLKSQAQTVAVPEFGTIYVNFSLDHGWTISGYVLDSGGVPLSGVDMDAFAWDRSFISSIDATSAVDGSFTLGCFPAGTFYLKAQPVPPDMHVVDYYNGHRDIVDADPVVVSAGNVYGITFHLSLGGTIAGTIRRQGDGLPLDGIDLDLFDSLGNFVGYVDAVSQLDGTYTIGAVPTGDYYLQADPTQQQGYVDVFYPGVLDITLATPIHVTAGVPLAGIDFSLTLGGTIAGAIRRQSNGLPLAGIDIDLFDPLGNFLGYADASSAADGTYTIGALMPGDFYVQADPTPLQGLIDTYYPGVFDVTLATLVHVTAGSQTGAIDIPLPVGGTISGRVTNATTGMPVADTRMTLFDSQGAIVSGAGGTTAADGTFMVGAVSTGSYRLRCYGDAVQNLAFEFYPGVTLLSQAQPIPVTAGSNVPNINFTLDRGGWITGRVRSYQTGQPLSLVDLNVYSLDGEYVGALDALTDANGGYMLDRVPAGSFHVGAFPTPPARYRSQYYLRKVTLPEANPIAVIAGRLTTGIDFFLYSTEVVDVGDGPLDGASGRLFLRNAPNPTADAGIVTFRLPEAGPVRLGVYDISGRPEATLADGFMERGEHTVTWTGIGSNGRPLPNGIHFLRLEANGKTEFRRLTVLR